MSHMLHHTFRHPVVVCTVETLQFLIALPPHWQVCGSAQHPSLMCKPCLGHVQALLWTCASLVVDNCKPCSGHGLGPGHKNLTEQGCCMQVVVAVDDSRSMGENGCGSFALEALTLICRAMARLEVGEMGVVSYGGSNSILPLHPLEKPFTDANGPGIMAQMKFDQVQSHRMTLSESQHHVLTV